MFRHRVHQSALSGALTTLELIFHAAVRSIRAKHNNAFVAIFLNMLQVIMLVVIFYVMFTILGLRRMAVRGDFLLYVMSGIFMYQSHVKACGAVAGAEGPASPMMTLSLLRSIIPIVSPIIRPKTAQPIILLPAEMLDSVEASVWVNPCRLTISPKTATNRLMLLAAKKSPPLWEAIARKRPSSYSSPTPTR